MAQYNLLGHPCFWDLKMITLLKNYINLRPWEVNLVLSVELVLTAVLLHWLILKVAQFNLQKFFPQLMKKLAVKDYFSPWIFLSLLSLLGTLFSNEFFIHDSSRKKLEHLVFIVAVFCGVKLLVRFIYLIRQIFASRLDYKVADNLRQRTMSTQFQFIEKLVVITVWTIAVVAVLCSFESARAFGTSLLASAGVMGIVIGFAAQKSLSNLLAGFQIAFTQPIRLDDVVIVEGQWGKVEEITLTYVVVCLWDLRRLVVPINYFIEKSFENWTKNSTDLLPHVLIYTDYHLPIAEFRKEFETILKETSLWDGRVAVVHVFDVTERSMILRALMSASDYSKAADLRFLVREKLLSFIQEKYPQCMPKTRVITDLAPSSPLTDFKAASEKLSFSAVAEA